VLTVFGHTNNRHARERDQRHRLCGETGKSGIIPVGHAFVGR